MYTVPCSFSRTKCYYYFLCPSTAGKKILPWLLRAEAMMARRESQLSSGVTVVIYSLLGSKAIMSADWVRGSPSLRIGSDLTPFLLPQLPWLPHQSPQRHPWAVDSSDLCPAMWVFCHFNWAEDTQVIRMPLGKHDSTDHGQI